MRKIKPLISIMIVNLHMNFWAYFFVTNGLFYLYTFRIEFSISDHCVPLQKTTFQATYTHHRFAAPWTFFILHSVRQLQILVKLWQILADFGRFWQISEDFGRFRLILADFSWFWQIGPDISVNRYFVLRADVSETQYLLEFLYSIVTKEEAIK
mgnify:CR=1 FL=1